VLLSVEILCPTGKPGIPQLGYFAVLSSSALDAYPPATYHAGTKMLDLECQALFVDPIRCPYCIEGNGFKLMIRLGNEQQFVCLKCHHLAIPDCFAFRCLCLNCLKVYAHHRQSAMASKDTYLPAFPRQRRSRKRNIHS